MKLIIASMDQMPKTAVGPHILMNSVLMFVLGKFRYAVNQSASYTHLSIYLPIS